jgi:hypothetical protein
MKIFNFNINSSILLLSGIILFALIIRPRMSPKEGFSVVGNPVKEAKSIMEGLGLIASPKNNVSIDDTQSDSESESESDTDIELNETDSEPDSETDSE